VGTESFPEVKRAALGVEHLPPFSVYVKERVELYLYYSLSGTVTPVLG
jgi:hypothetical protein